MRQVQFKRLAALFAATVSVAALAPAAHAGVVISWTGVPIAIPANNDFQTQLSTTYNLNRYVGTALTQLDLQTNSTISFYFLGSESAAGDGFTTLLGSSTVACSETTNGVIPWAGPVGTPCGGAGNNSATFTAGTLYDNLRFLGPTNANPDSVGFGVFLRADQVNGGAVNEFFFGFDDNGSDDNHDDYIIRAVVTPNGVPEPATWAMMLVGFGAIGFGLRRQRQTTRVRYNFA